MHTNNKMATDDDIYDVDLASGSYLYAFGRFSRRRNRQTRPRRFWVHVLLRCRDDLGEYARLLQELRLDSDRLSGQVPPIQISLTRPYVSGAVWTTHFTYTVCSTVYVQGRTNGRAACAEIEHVSIYAFRDRRTTSYVVVRRRTTSYAV